MFDKKKKFVLIGLVVIIFAGFLFLDIPFARAVTGDYLRSTNCTLSGGIYKCGDKYYKEVSTPTGDEYGGAITTIYETDSAGRDIKGETTVQRMGSAAGGLGLSTETTKNGVTTYQRGSPDSTSALEYIQNVLGWLIYLIFAALGWIITQLVWVMLTVMTYPIDINNTSAVVTGWKVVRDLCNNFFIILLIVVAIGTIIGKKEYSFKSLLPKILLAAILVNFSKLFVGLAIDISQIIMLSFASAFATIEGGNIVLSAIGLPNFAKIASPTGTTLSENGAGTFAKGASFDFVNILAVLIYAIIISIILIIVLAVIVAILVIRIIALLFLTVLSPLYFFGQSFGPIGKQTEKWMGFFSKYLIVGPTLLFFLWLSIMMMGVQSDQQVSGSIEGMPTTVDPARNNADNPMGKTPLGSELELQRLSEAMSIKGMINTAMVIGMLCMTLYMASISGVAGAKLGGDALGWIKKQGKKPMGWGKSLGKTAMTKVDRATGLRAVRQGVGGYFAQRKKAGEEIDKKRAGIVAGSLGFAVGATVGAPGKIASWAKGKTLSKWLGVKEREDKLKKGKSQLDRLEADGHAKKINDAKDGDTVDIGNGMKVLKTGDTWTLEHYNAIGAMDSYAPQLDKDNMLRLISSSLDVDNFEKIKNKKAFKDDSGEDFSYREGIGWRRDRDGRVFNEDELKKEMDLARGDKVAAILPSFVGRNAEYIKERSNKEGGFTKEDLGNIDVELSKRRWWESVATGTLKAGMMGAGAGFGALGLPWMAGLGGLSTIFGAGASANAVGGAVIGVGLGAGIGAATGSGLANISDWGSADRKFASSFKQNIVDDIRKDLKNMDDGELKTVLDDKSLDRFTRIASGLEAISRGILSPQRVEYERLQIARLSKTLPIAGGAVGKADKKINDTLDKELSKNYVDQSKLFTDLRDITKRDAALIKINSQIEGGKLKMEEFDPRSLALMGRQFAEALGASRFGKQFDNLSKTQQDAIKGNLVSRAVSGEAGVDERKVLFKLGDAVSALTRIAPNSDESRKITQSLGLEDFKKFMQGATADQVTALSTALAGQASNLHRSVASSTNNEIRTMRRNLGI